MRFRIGTKLKSWIRIGTETFPIQNTVHYSLPGTVYADKCESFRKYLSPLFVPAPVLGICMNTPFLYAKEKAMLWIVIVLMPIRIRLPITMPIQILPQVLQIVEGLAALPV